MNISTPDELVSFLMELFPSFEGEWAIANQEFAENSEYMGSSSELTFHRVLQTFSPISTQLLETSSPKQVQTFCDFLNSAVAGGGNLENAVSTCLLEHASQLGIFKLLKSYLSGAALRELR